jgi:hypothetical protein
MRPARVGRLPTVAAVVLLLGSSSVAGAQFGPPELVPPSYLPPAAPGVPTIIVTSDSAPAPGTTKLGDMTKLYEQCLTCDRPVKYARVSCSKHKGCFQKETLFEWSVGCDPQKNDGDDKNGNGTENGNGEAEEPKEEERLVSDRPDFTEDIRAGIGLSRGVADSFTGAGFAVRY